MTESVILYGLMGVCVAIGTAMQESSGWWSTLLAGAMWPAFLPFLLRGPVAAPSVTSPRSKVTSERAGRIRIAISTLSDAVESLSVHQDLRPSEEVIEKLCVVLSRRAERIDELEALLRQPEFSQPRAEQALAEAGPSGSAVRRSLEARLRNISRLDRMRGRSIEAFEAALLEVEEMGAQTTVLRFVEADHGEAEEILRDVSASIEGLTDCLVDDRAPLVDDGALAR